METNKEKEFLSLKQKLIQEIEYRYEIIRQLSWDSSKQKGFVTNFIRTFLKIKETNAPNLFWKDRETYGRYLIDHDKELHQDIIIALEKSIAKLQKDYNEADFNYLKPLKNETN